MRARTHHAADVGRDDHDRFVRIEAAPSSMSADITGAREQIVGRDIEEALDLTRRGDRRVSTRSAPARLDQVGDELGRDRRARAGLPVLPGVAEIGDHRCDAARGSERLQRIDQDQAVPSCWSLAGNDVDCTMNDVLGRGTFS